MTDQCNFQCSYCYEPRGEQRLDPSVLIKAIDYFFPLMTPDCCICFYGGEPLLAFDTLTQAVGHLDGLDVKRRIKPRYTLTTNGSLLDDEILRFLEGHRFSVMLSFDGLAQDVQRKKGTFELLSSVITRILARPGITLETNSVFSAETVDHLSESIQLLIRLGVPKLDINFAHKPSWNEASLLRLKKEIRRIGDYFLSRYDSLTDIPWPGLCRGLDRAVLHCPAGDSQMAISAQGTVWGCAVFPHYFQGKKGTAEGQEYCFGDIDSFIKDPGSIYAQKMANYSRLSMDCFSTPDRSCLDCREIDRCWICPVAAALTTGEIGRIPGWSCEGAKILREERRLFLDRFEKKLQNSNPRPAD